MHSLALSRFPAPKVDAIFASVEFFSQFRTEFPHDFQRVLPHCKLVVIEPNEYLIQAGEYDSWFYFLLSGELNVFLSTTSAKSVGVIYPGEIVGALAILQEQERSAFVKASRGRRSLLLAVDFTPFGEWDDFSYISEAAKKWLLMYVASHTEQRLHAYHQVYPDTDLERRLFEASQVPKDAASAQTVEYGLQRVNLLASLLSEWNLTLENVDDYHPSLSLPPQDIVRDLEQLFFQ